MPNAPLMVRQQPGGQFAIVNMEPTTGEYFFVHSGTGTDGAGYGRNPDSPCATIDYAIGLCTASKGDRILVMPGHAETVTGDIDVDVAGISIIGLGNGENRPIVTFGTNTTAKVDVDAANCRIENIVFKTAIDAQAIVIDVDGAGFTCRNCDFLEGTAIQYLIGIDLAEDRALVEGCYFKSVTAGANSAIKISAAKDRITLLRNEVFGDFADACIHNPTGTVATSLRIDDNVLTNLQTGDHAIELVSACTGVINRNIVNSTLAAAGGLTAIDQGACFANQNYGVDATADVSGLLNPIADA